MENKNNSVIERFAKKGVFPYQFAFTLVNTNKKYFSFTSKPYRTS